MNSSTLKFLARTSLAALLVAGAANTWAQRPNVAVTRPVQPQPTPPIYYPPGTAPKPIPPIALPPDGVKPEQPIYRPPSSGWVDPAQQFGLPCPGSTSIIAGTIYYVCGERYFIQQNGPNGVVYEEVPAPN